MRRKLRKIRKVVSFSIDESELGKMVNIRRIFPNLDLDGLYAYIDSLPPDMTNVEVALDLLEKQSHAALMLAACYGVSKIIESNVLRSMKTKRLLRMWDEIKGTGGGTPCQN